LAGYLNVVRTESYDFYSKTVSHFLSSDQEAWLGARLIIPSIYDDQLLEQCLDALEAGRIEATEFSSLCYGQAAQAVHSAQMGRLIQYLQARPDKNSNNLLLNLLNALPFNDTSSFGAQLVFESIIMAIPVENHWEQMSGYIWKKVCNKLIKWDASYAMPLLDALFTEMGKEYRLSYDSYVGTLANELTRLNASGTWSLLIKHFEATLPKWRTDLLDWLKGGMMRFDEKKTYSPIADLPMKEILLWIEQDIENRAALIANAAPSTLDDEGGGQLTRELLVRYSSIDRVSSGINVISHSGVFTGPRSQHLKRKRDMLRTWLSAGFQYEVTQWVEGELEELDQSIEAAEIAEERDRFY
jgi:hypothetical protein